MAISEGPRKKILGVGAEARAAGLGAPSIIVNPFAHPRSLVSDFTCAEQLLKAFVRRLQKRSLFAFPPVVVMHPLGEPDGGFTQVEIRAFREMAVGAGASKVFIRFGRELTDQDLQGL
jgi:rod shape-determining protein MreB